MIEPRFKNARPFSDGLAEAESDGKYGYIDKTGTFVIKPNFAETKQFVDGVAQARSKLNGLWGGYIDRNGKLAFDRWFDQAYSFSGGMAAVLERDSEGRAHYGYIDTSGSFFIEPRFSAAGPLEVFDPK